MFFLNLLTHLICQSNGFYDCLLTPLLQRTRDISISSSALFGDDMSPDPVLKVKSMRLPLFLINHATRLKQHPMQWYEGPQGWHATMGNAHIPVYSPDGPTLFIGYELVFQALQGPWGNTPKQQIYYLILSIGHF